MADSLEMVMPAVMGSLAGPGQCRSRFSCRRHRASKAARRGSPFPGEHSLRCLHHQPRLQDAFTLDVSEVPQGLGSGFVWDKEGHIVNNYHHVICGASNLKWALIAKRVPGRTDNQVKNYWNTCLSKMLAAKDQSCRLGIKEKLSRVCKSRSEISRAVKLSKTTIMESDSSPFVNTYTTSDTAANKDSPGGTIEASRIQEPKFEDSPATPFWIFDDSLELDALGMELFDGNYVDLS